MANVDGVHEPKLRRDLEEDVTHALDDERLFTLAHVEHFQELTIRAADIVEVSKDIIDESVELSVGYHRRIRIAYWSNEDLWLRRKTISWIILATAD
jgi:hypothetical protein